MRAVARADKPVHLHVLARDVVDDRSHRLLSFPRGLVQLDRLARVGDDLAAEHDFHVGPRRIGVDAVTRILLEAGSGIHAQPFCIAAIAFFISSGVTSRRCVATDQWWPNGSSSLP